MIDDFKSSCRNRILLLSAPQYFFPELNVPLQQIKISENNIAYCIAIMIVDTGAHPVLAEQHATRVTSLAVRCSKCERHPLLKGTLCNAKQQNRVPFGKALRPLIHIAHPASKHRAMRKGPCCS